MSFDQQKKDCLQRKDKSFKNSVDAAIVPLIDLLNASSAYYTTSSCSGRIVLLGGTSKKDASFLYVTHDVVDVDKLWMALADAEKASLRQEGFIVHVCCRSFDASHALLDLARGAGLKRTAIIYAEDRIVVELVGSSQMDTLACKNGKVLVDKEYVDTWSGEAAERLKKNLDHLEEFTALVKSVHAD